jgi:hypothetical protein
MLVHFHLLLRDFGPYVIIFSNVCIVINVAMVRSFSLKEGLSFVYVALWKQCKETTYCSFTHGLLCTYTSSQRSATDVYVLTLRTSSNEAKMGDGCNFHMLICHISQ